MTQADALKVLLGVADAMLEAIRAAGPDGIPAGHLYAAVCDKVTLSLFEAVIGGLVGAGKITRDNHVLRAVPAR